ncbi:DNA-3-methyladenine glycosylase [Ornithinibacillus halotolerans]|uniref:Putative 3-methyladenine DNA glycosylase n=1 Tax=Ornithinibacillus halotolerans TaxID=1274357 RepID=A0A916S282_9BACI|nr:DNA-3-methyladenine glycosylase [Ornithinibacillus halotolerans]GGA80976.1 putative 3-methyladenine DNA glycosylase [Ornithinibacillus halotolerans]
MTNSFTPLPKEFYEEPTLTLAQKLLGCVLVKITDESITSGVIVETEAYLGAIDRAAHSFQNRRTKRTEIMFSEPGLVYTYQMHTHCLVNVVSGPINTPEAILIRAVEPYTGIHTMLKRRPVPLIKNLTNGPGKLTKALGIGMEDYGKPFYHSNIIIAKGKEPKTIVRGKRIGIGNSGEAKDYPYRFWVLDNPFVSR